MPSRPTAKSRWRANCLSTHRSPRPAPGVFVPRFRGDGQPPKMTDQRPTATTQRNPWRRVLVIWPFLVTVAVLLLLGNASLNVMAGLRAFVSAESHWSKAQKVAVGHLERYAETRNEDSYGRYLAEMSAAAGLRTARIELEKAIPDFDVARRGFRDARNQPDDIESMIALFRRFRNVGFMATTVAIWAQADAQLVELDAVAQALHSAIAAGKSRVVDLPALSIRVRAIDRQLTPLEDAFSANLGSVRSQTFGMSRRASEMHQW